MKKFTSLLLACLPSLVLAQNSEFYGNFTPTVSHLVPIALKDAVDFHLAIGSERKEKRLFALKKYWTDQVKNLPGVLFYITDCP